MTAPLSALSALEQALVELVAAAHWPGLHIAALQVTRRENTGAGRYTYFADLLNQGLRNGTYTAPGRFIQMDGLRDGLAFVVDVSAERINYLEIAVYGNERWDGIERAWEIL